MLSETPVVLAFTFDDVSFWARGRGLEIVLLVTGAILLARFVSWRAGAEDTSSFSTLPTSYLARTAWPSPSIMT